MSEVTRVLEAIDRGDPQATRDLLPLVYDELRRLAARKLAQEKPGQTLDATGLVHKTYMRLVAGASDPAGDPRRADRRQFFAASAEAMRRILVENARRKGRLKHGGGRRRAAAQLDSLAAGESPRELLALHEALEEFALHGGATDDGRPFFVMEYVQGVPLAQYCDDARVTVAQRLALSAPVCQAVQHAHTKGVVHRDLLAWMYRAMGRTSEAIPLAERVREALILNLGAYHPRTIHAVNKLALAYEAGGDPEKALAMHLQAAAGLERLGFSHVDAYRIVESLAECLGQLDRNDEADAWRRKWLAAVKEKEKDGPESVAYARTLLQIGDRLLEQERYADAEPLLRESLDVHRKALPGSRDASVAESSFVAVLLALKKYDEAEPRLIRGYEALHARGAGGPPLERFEAEQAGDRIIELYNAWGRADKAAEWRKKLDGSTRDDPGHGSTP